MTACVVDGRLSTLEAERVDLGNRSFRYGDGLFETFVGAGGRVMLWAEHMARLSGGMALLGLDAAPALEGELLAGLSRLHAALGLGGGPFGGRLMVWRRGGGRYAPPGGSFSWLLESWSKAEAFGLSVEAVRVGLFPEAVLVGNGLSRYKRNSALPYVWASGWCGSEGLDDCLLQDALGRVGEALSSNVFWRSEGRWHVPGLEAGGVAGSVRAHVLGRGLAREATLPCADLESVEAMVLANANGVRVVGRLLGRSLDEAAGRSWVEGWLAGALLS